MTAKSMKVKDFMSKYVFTVSADTTVHELVGLFITHPVSAIPVVGDDNELLGIVSEGDLLYKKVNPKIPQYVDVLGGNLYYCGFGRYERSFRKLLATTASEIMTKDVRCVTSATDMETLTTLQKTLHKTVVVVMHNLSTAVKYANRIVVMDSGKIVFEGTTQECLEAQIIEKTFGVKKHISEGEFFFS